MKDEKDEKLALEKKILTRLLPGLEPATFRSRVCRSTSEPSLRSCRDSNPRLFDHESVAALPLSHPCSRHKLK